jgi:hypothetical protein
VIIAIAGAVGSLVLLITQLLTSRKQRLVGILRYRPAKIWKIIPSLIAFLCFFSIAVYFYFSGGTSSASFAEKRELALKVDSLSELLNKARMQQDSEKAGHFRREGELTSALKSKITNAYMLATPVVRTDTVVIVVRDTTNERRLKGRLEYMQLKNFELLKTLDSLRSQGAANEKDEK